MASLSSDDKLSPPERHDDFGLGLEQEDLQTTAPDSPESPTETSPARDSRDNTDDTGATMEQNLAHGDHQPSKAKQTPTLEMPEDLTSTAYEGHEHASTSASPVEAAHLVDKAIDGTTLEAERSRSRASFSAVNELESFDDAHGTSSSPEVNTHAEKQISLGKMPLVRALSEDTSSTGGDHMHGGTAISSADRPQGNVISDDNSTSRSRKRKVATAPTDGQLPEAHEEQHGSKRTKVSTNSSSLDAVESAKVDSGSVVSNSVPTTNATATQAGIAVAAATHAPAQDPTDAQHVATSRASATHTSAIDRKIAQLRNLCRPLPVLWHESVPRRVKPEQLGMERRAKKLDSTILDHSVGKVAKLTKPKVCRWLASNDVLPILDQFRAECLDNPVVHAGLSNALILANKPWKAEAELIASCAKDYDDVTSGRIQFNHPHRVAMIRCAKFVRLLVHKSRANIMYYYDECAFLDMDRFLHELCTRALLTAYYDYPRNAKGFFSTLFASSFVVPMTWQTRQSRKRELGFSSSIPEAEYRTPSLTIHRAVDEFGRAMKRKTTQETNNDDSKLLVTETESRMADHLTKQLKAFETEADAATEADPPHDISLAINAGPVVSGPVRSGTLPARIVDHMSVCTQGCNPVIRPAPPVDQFFARDRDTGCIVPSSKVAAAPNDMDPFTNLEQLILYLRYKAVHSNPPVPFLDGTPLTTTAFELMKWGAIAEVLPGRSIADCITFYKLNIQHFQS